MIKKKQIKKLENKFKKGFTLIEMLIVVIIIWILMWSVLSISVWEINYAKYKLIWQIVNQDNVYMKWTNNILKICSIQLTGEIWNTHLQPIFSKCINYRYFINLPNWINFYKVQWIIMNANLLPIKSYTHRWIFKVKNWVLFIN